MIRILFSYDLLHVTGEPYSCGCECVQRKQKVIEEKPYEETLGLALLTDFFLDEDWKHIRRWHPEIARKLKQLRVNCASAEEHNAMVEQVSDLRNDVKNLCLLITKLEQQFNRDTQNKRKHP